MFPKYWARYRSSHALSANGHIWRWIIVEVTATWWAGEHFLSNFQINKNIKKLNVLYILSINRVRYTVYRKLKTIWLISFGFKRFDSKCSKQNTIMPMIFYSILFSNRYNSKRFIWYRNNTHCLSQLSLTGSSYGL